MGWWRIQIKSGCLFITEQLYIFSTVTPQVNCLTRLHLIRQIPASPHLFNPAGSAHTYIQIFHTYYSSTDDHQPRETWHSNEK
jgi:hypothetical protein